MWALGLAAAFLVVAMKWPRILRPLNLTWFRFGMLLSSVISPVVMSVIFLLAVTPTAVVVRLIGRDPLRLKIDRDAKSYWITRNQDSNPMSSMKNQF